MKSLEFMMTIPLCRTGLLVKFNLWKEDIKCDYHSKRIINSFPIILHCAIQGWCHCVKADVSRQYNEVCQEQLK